MKQTTRSSLTAFAVLLVVGAACTSSDEPPRAEKAEAVVAVGDPAPVFALPTSNGQELSLAEFRGKKAVLLYFSMGPG